jgi:DNA topoisomerase-1
MDTDSDTPLRPAPLSVRNGPIDDDDDDAPLVNGNGKRKSRSSVSNINYHESDSEGVRSVSSHNPTQVWISSANMDARPNGKEKLPQTIPIPMFPSRAGVDFLPLLMRLLLPRIQTMMSL